MYGAPVWNGAKTTRGIPREDPEASTTDQRISGSNFTNYEETLQMCQSKTLRQRKEDLCLKFIEKTLKKLTSSKTTSCQHPQKK